MSYYKPTVEAGRVREDEALPFFGQNKIATPVRITSFNSVGGQTAKPAITEDPNEFVGKSVDLGLPTGTSTKRNKGTGRPPTINLG